MGLKNKLKKQKGDKEKPEEIGGLLEDAVLPGRLSDAPPPVVNVPEIPESSEKPFAQGFPDATEDIEESPKAAKNDDDLSALDIFAAETAEDEEESRLTDQLPQIDIHDLLMECREIMAMLKENIE